MRKPLLALLAGACVLLAGCSVPADVEAAKESVRQAQDALRDTQEKLDAAQAEARQAKERLDRARSAQVVRAELVNLSLTPVVENRTLAFSVRAERDGVVIPLENLTSLPPLVVVGEQEGSWGVVCDPLSCRVFLPEGARALAFWQDEPETRWAVPDERIVRDNAPITATVALGDWAS